MSSKLSPFEVGSKSGLWRTIFYSKCYQACAFFQLVFFRVLLHVGHVTLSKVFEVCRSTGLIRLSWVNSCSLHEVTASIFLWSWNELRLKTLLLTLLRSDGLRADVSSLHWLGGDVNKVSIKKGPQECFTHAQMVSLLINLYCVDSSFWRFCVAVVVIVDATSATKAFDEKSIFGLKKAFSASAAFGRVAHLDFSVNGQHFVSIRFGLWWTHDFIRGAEFESHWLIHF